MHEWAGGFTGALVTGNETLEQEFDDRLRDSGTLAFRVAYGVLRHREDAEDVAQEAFARAYRHFNSLRDREQFRSWLVRTTWRLAIDRWRAERRRIAREQSIEEPTTHETNEDLALSRERASHLWRAIDALSDKLRVVVVLSAIEGHDVGDVARLLRLPEGTVKSRLFNARKSLAESLKCLKNH
jgi:RNA polymerase sigma-70 factor (ECF subfamily)